MLTLKSTAKKKKPTDSKKSLEKFKNTKSYRSKSRYIVSSTPKLATTTKNKENIDGLEKYFLNKNRKSKCSTVNSKSSESCEKKNKDNSGVRRYLNEAKIIPFHSQITLDSVTDKKETLLKLMNDQTNLKTTTASFSNEFIVNKFKEPFRKTNFFSNMHKTYTQELIDIYNTKFEIEEAEKNSKQTVKDVQVQTTLVLDDSKSTDKKMPHSKVKEVQIRPKSQGDILNKKATPIGQNNPINLADSNQMFDLNIQRLNSTRSAHNQTAFVKPTVPFFLFGENSSQNLNKPSDKKFELSKINKIDTNNLKLEDLY